MHAPALELASLIDIKHLGATVHAGADDNIGAGPFKTDDAVAMGGRVGAATGFGFPHVKATITITARNILAIRAKANSGNPIGVFLYFVNKLTSLCGENT